jgi:nucleoside-diphosphate-sugar epimerase
MKVLVTGANGFVGTALVQQLASAGHHVVAHARQTSANLTRFAGHITPVHGSYESLPQWADALDGCDAVVHAAARVHQVRDAAPTPLAAYRLVNVQHTLDLARAAAACEVKRFVFVSSIKVNGEWSAPHQPFSADDAPNALDPYGISKQEAEAGLRTLAAQTGMQTTIVRPPLVYGPGVKANFLTMMRWLERGVPLPLGAIANQRSLVALDNLVDLLQLCLTHPGAANQTFLVSDGHDVSTTELLAKLADALHVKARLVPVPQAWLEAGLGLLGRKAVAQRLCGNLAVDISKTRSLLGWTAPLTLSQGLRATAAHYLSQRGA